VLNSIKKYVVSNSLQAANWENPELISGDVAHKLTDIKAQDGGDISITGSATTVRWLLREGLVDELNLLVHPLELRSADTFTTGVLNLSYVPGKD
jgi:dihydrofolate reductase